MQYKKITAAVALLAAGTAHTAVLEEVVVTAQLREQSLQDVPVSVSAIAGETMQEAGIGRIEDLQAYVPNLHMSESQITTDIFIRGIGSGANQGFEQSVGMYVDGVYYGKGQLARAPFLDLARVEVLRGPQNILMGKNSIAGAVSIVTADPDEEGGGRISTTYEPRFNTRTVEFSHSGPISDAFGYRLAGRLLQSDGFMENLTLDRDEPERDEKTLRLKFKWDVNDDLSAKLKLEYSRFEVTGRHAEIIRADPSEASGDAGLFAGRNWGEILDRTVFPDAGAGLNLPPAIVALVGIQPDGSVLNIDADSSVLNNTQDYKRHANEEHSETDLYNVTFNLDYYVDGHTFSAITGYMAYEFDDLCDCDATGAEIFQAGFFEDYEQFSQEVRWISPVGETFEFIGGLYFQKSEFYFFDTLIVPDDPSAILVQLLNAGDLLAGGATGDADPNPAGSNAFEVAGIGDAGNNMIGYRSPRDFITDSTLWSGFLQGTWNLRDDLRLTLGGRYTDEKKEGARKVELAFPDFSIRPRGEIDTVVAINFAVERHDLEGDRHERQFSPLLNLQYDWSPDLMSYFTASRGFKSGGFDARSNSSPEANIANPHATPDRQRVLIGSFEYEEEQATSYELGIKSTLLDGAAELNAALFRTEYDDLQVSIYDGTLGFNVANAASAISQGVELDGRLQITEHLMLRGGLSLLDFEFQDFEDGTCSQGQAPNSADGFHCDFSGMTNQYVSDWNANLGFHYERDLGSSLMFRSNIDLIGVGDYNPTSNLDERVEQDGYVKVNARLSLGAIAGDWELALLGKNLTDEAVVASAFDTPVAYTAAQAPTWHAFLEPPRTVALQASLRW